MKMITGGVTAAKGFEAAAAEAQIKYKDRKDMALIYSQVPCVVAGTFTTNVVKAAPVRWDQEIVKKSANVHLYRNEEVSIKIKCIIVLISCNRISDSSVETVILFTSSDSSARRSTELFT